MFILLVTDFNGRCGLYKKYLCAAILNLVLSILFDQIIFASHNSHLKEFRFCKTFKDKLVQLLVDYCENLPALKKLFIYKPWISFSGFDIRYVKQQRILLVQFYGHFNPTSCGVFRVYEKRVVHIRAVQLHHRSSFSDTFLLRLLKRVQLNYRRTDLYLYFLLTPTPARRWHMIPWSIILLLKIFSDKHNLHENKMWNIFLILRWRWRCSAPVWRYADGSQTRI